MDKFKQQHQQDSCLTIIKQKLTYVPPLSLSLAEWNFLLFHGLVVRDTPICPKHLHYGYSKDEETWIVTILSPVHSKLS